MFVIICTVDYLSEATMQPRGERPYILSFRLEHLLGWGVTLFLCLVPVYFWLQIHPLSTIHGLPAILLALGRVTGLIGTVMYALNLVYATRLRFLEYFFGGLNRVYIAHHILGGLALVFLSFHPFLLALRLVKISIKEAALMLVPNGLTPLNALFNSSLDLHKTVLGQWALLFGIIAFWGLVGLLIVTLFMKLPYRVWLFTHKFLGVAFFFAGLHILFITSDTSTQNLLRIYMLVIVSIGLLGFCYKTLTGKILIRKYRYTVDHVIVSGGNVTQILMRPVQEKMMHKSGQFVFIRFFDQSTKSVSHEWHPFSIASGPKDVFLRLIVKGLGDYTNKLVNLKEGSIAEVEGAYGKFTYSNYSNLKQIWVAGGIGITPFLSMARDLPDKDFAIDLYYSVKTSNELINWDELDEISKLKKGQLRVIPFVGDQQEGFLTADYIEKTSNGVQGKDIFICGPPPMMKAMRTQFRALSVPGTAIHTEEFAMS